MSAFLPEIVKRLDFDDISLTMPPAESPLAELLKEVERLRSGLHDISLREGNAEIMEMARASVHKFEGLDFSGLKEIWSKQKIDFIKLHAENNFLKCLTDDESNESHVHDLEALQREHIEIKHEAVETNQEIISLFETYAKDMESFEEKLVSTEECLDACTSKISQLEESTLSHDLWDINNYPIGERHAHADDTFLEAEVRLLKTDEAELSELILDEDAQKIRKETLEMDIEIGRLEKQIELREKDLECLQETVKMRIRAELLQRVLEFSSNVRVGGCKNGCINLILRTPLFHVEQVENGLCVNSSISQVVKYISHKMLIKINEKTFVLEDAKLDSNDIQIDDIVCAAKTRTHCLNLSKSLEFLLRKTQQRISMYKSNARDFL